VNLRFLLTDLIDYLTNEQAFRDKDERPAFGEITKSLNSVLVARTFIEWLSRTPEAVDWLAARGVFVFGQPPAGQAAFQPNRPHADGNPLGEPTGPATNVVRVNIDGRERRCVVVASKGGGMFQVQSVDLPHYVGVAQLHQVVPEDRDVAHILVEQLERSAAGPPPFTPRRMFRPGADETRLKPETEKINGQDEPAP
jgi:hypothetical protein